MGYYRNGQLTLLIYRTAEKQLPGLRWQKINQLTCIPGSRWTYYLASYFYIACAKLKSTYTNCIIAALKWSIPKHVIMVQSYGPEEMGIVEEYIHDLRAMQ